MTTADVAAALTGERVVGKNTGGDPPSSREEIAGLAYQYYEARGRQDGQDVDDWLSAEQELQRHYALPRRKRGHGTGRGKFLPAQTAMEATR